MTEITPGKLLGLRRLADQHGRFKMLAVDQRPPIENLVMTKRNAGQAVFDDVAAVKMTLIRKLATGASAVLVDPQYAFPSAIPILPDRIGLLITLEDDRFEETPEGRLSSSIPDWSVAKIRASGGDAVKVLAWYRPDASQRVREHQMEFVRGIGDDCRRLDIPFVFELLLYPFPGEATHTSDYVEDPAKRSDHVIESVETFADSSYGIDLFKLESPVPASAVAGPNALQEHRLAASFEELDRAAERPWVVLSAGADPSSFYRILELAFDAGASGYLAGRAIWWEACEPSFPDWDRMEKALETSAVPYMTDINELADNRARPWMTHPVFGEEGPRPPAAGSKFRETYLEDER